MRIKAFKAYRPPLELTEKLASLPYDVYSVEEARELTADNPHAFLHISIPAVDLPEDTPEKDESVYQKAGENFQTFITKGYLVQDEQPGLFLYRQIMGKHAQRGLVAVSHVNDYDKELIKKHEHTRAAPEEDRTRHIEALNAQAGPVFLTYRDVPEINDLLSEIEKTEPLFDFTAPDGIQHAAWRIPETERLVQLFDAIPVDYIADGHHRASAASRVARERRAAHPEHSGDEEYNWFLTVLFPATQLQILPYNRCIADLQGLTPNELLEAIRLAGFALRETTLTKPDKPGTICMYLAGKWYEMTCPEVDSSDPVQTMDVSILQNRVLAPILGIDDPRKNPRASFVGGIRGPEELKKRVDSGRDAVAFSMYPTDIRKLMDVADANLVMPPKSTWFEPKLRSGLFVHALD
ncbi:MAG: DUF1015 family protein [Kiritimatiellae bacterium]|nr:DUF1015 family protein [Kiritimatiellia bacterium]